MKKKWIPFKYTPAAWGLSGEAYEVAKACYELEGLDLGLKLANIKYAHDDYNRFKYINKVKLDNNEITLYEYQTRELKNEFNYGKISEYDYHSRMLKLDYDRGQKPTYDYDLALLKRDYNVITEKEYQLEFAKLELDSGKISPTEYEKQIATINDEPWVKVMSLTTEDDRPGSGSLELDWNTKFVEDLKEHGYEGSTEEQIVDQWLSELCKNIAAQHYAGTGYFDEVMGIDPGSNVVQHSFIKSTTQNNKREVK